MNCDIAHVRNSSSTYSVGMIMDQSDLRDVCDASYVHDVPVEKNETRRLL